METWDREIKNFVRRKQFAPFAGQRFGTMLDLAGPEFLSPLQALSQEAITKDSWLCIPEVVYSEYEKLYNAIPNMVFTNIDISPKDIVDLVLPDEREIGLLNLDGMRQTRPEDIHLIDRVPYQKKAGAILTFHHPCSRGRSQFINDSANLIDEMDSTLNPDLKETFHNNHVYFTFIGDTIDVSALSEDNFRWGFYVFLLMMFALRNHEFRVAKIITYSTEKKNKGHRMISVVVKDIVRTRGIANREPVYIDRANQYVRLLRQFAEFIASSGSTISQ